MKIPLQSLTSYLHIRSTVGHNFCTELYAWYSHGNPTVVWVKSSIQAAVVMVVKCNRQLYKLWVQLFINSSTTVLILKQSGSLQCSLGPAWDKVSVHRSSSLDWKKDRNRTEPNRKRPDHRLRLPKFWIFSVASCDVYRKIEKPEKTGLDRLQPVFRPVTCYTLLTHIFP